MNFGLLCCGCQEGAVVPRWQNVTAVRLAAWHAAPGDCSVDVTTGAPQYRFNASWYDGFHASPACSSTSAPCDGQPPGSCGPWYASADGLNAFSTQDITDMVNDIMACGGSATTIDHNCFVQSGTVDHRAPQRFGGKWILARKYWHGVFGLKDRVDPHCITSVSCTTGPIGSGGGVFTFGYSDDPPDYPPPPQVKYRTVHIYGSSVTLEGGPAPAGTQVTCAFDTKNTVGQYTGVVTTLDSASNPSSDDFGPSYLGIINSDFNSLLSRYCYFAAPTSNPSSNYRFVAITGGWQCWYDDTGAGGTTNALVEELLISLTGASRKSYYYTTGTVSTLTAKEALTISNTQATITYNVYDTTPPSLHDQTLNGTITIDLLDPYTSGDVLNDWKILMQAWSLTDPGLYPFRTDEELANLPLLCYDEVTGAVVPTAVFPLNTMDDYTTPDGMGGWAQIEWRDPNDYFWTFNGSNRGLPGGWAGGSGAVLHTGIRTGNIISHTLPGSDPFFWFNFTDQTRVSNGDGFTWVLDTRGAYTPAPLPACAMRWQNKQESQYDAETVIDALVPGNFPQAFLHEYGGVLTGAKFVQATQPWPSVNYARPCGNDKYSVDQPTVCCAGSSDSSGGYLTLTTVNVTGNAIAPLFTGGLQAGDYIAVEGLGIYQISGIGGTGPWIINCTTSAPIEALPSGFSLSSAGAGYSEGVHVGRLRFYATAAATCTGVLNTTASQRTGVYLEWHFNPRAAFWPTPPDWYGGISGCLNLTVQQFNYGAGTCRAVVGIVPFYPPSPTGDQTPPDNQTPPASLPLESWSNQTLFPMPDTFQFDDLKGAHWQAAIMLTMPDPFWQQPFMPNCDGSSFAWQEDNGCGTADASDGTVKLFPHHPLVEAASVPASALPSGISLAYDPVHNIIPPPYYPNGIPIGDDSGDYGGVETDWGFAGRACANIDGSGRWSGFYSTFVNCTSVVRQTC